jgi:hypothetical protein
MKEALLQEFQDKTQRTLQHLLDDHSKKMTVNKS